MADEMLINGLIKFCDAKSKNMELKAEPQVYVEIKCALEELKAIKSDGFTDHLLNMGYTKGYRKAIDEIISQLDAEIESSAKFIREYDDSIAQKAYYKGLRNALDIVMQMKAGE